MKTVFALESTSLNMMLTKYFHVLKVRHIGHKVKKGLFKVVIYNPRAKQTTVYTHTHTNTIYLDGLDQDF